jgi:hypothetical protein
MSQVLYLAPSSDGFMSFLAFDFNVTVTDKDGNLAPGLQVVVYGYDEIWIMPLGAGEYVVTFEALGQTETIDITVEAPNILGEQFFTVEVLDSYCWSDGWTEDGVVYEFKPETYGKYTFYLPANFGMAEVNQWENSYIPNADYYGEANREVTVTIRPGQVFRFYFAAAVVGTYTIGYDAP